jgi:signal transduction histidine kinase
MQAEETGQPDSAEASPAARIRILAVDDEKAMRDAYAQVLGHDSRLRDAVDLEVRSQGQDGAAAVASGVASGSPFAAVFLDVRMPPGWDGVRTAEAIRKSDPDVNIVIVTAYSDVQQEDIAERVPPADKLLYIQKPCHAPELRQLALALGAKWQLERRLMAIQRGLEAKVKSRTRRLEGTVAELRREAAAREEAQREAARNQAGLLRAQKLAAIGTLVSGMAHEVSNPSNIIALNAATLRRMWEALGAELDARGCVPPEADVGGRSYLEARSEIPELISGIARSADRIGRMVSDLKSFARQEQGEEPAPVDLAAVLDGALPLVMPLVNSSTRRFSVEREKDVPPVMGNARQLEQVLVNLVTNACQSLPSRDCAVRVSLRLDGGDGTVRIEVGDEGCGIAQKDLPRVAEPFFTTKRDRGGTGLGLSVSDGIARRHGGRLEISSVPGKGTTAALVLPVAPKTEGPES